LFDTLIAEADSGPQVADLHAQIEAGAAKEGWLVMDRLLLFKGKVFVPKLHRCGH
jgi:hypothetical protein